MNATEVYFEKLLNRSSGKVKSGDSLEEVTVKGIEFQNMRSNISISGNTRHKFGLNFLYYFCGIGSCTKSEVNLINALIWIVKALGMRSHRDLDSWVEKVYLKEDLCFILQTLKSASTSNIHHNVFFNCSQIMHLLRDETLGEEVIKNIAFLVADDPYSLNEESFCVVR